MASITSRPGGSALAARLQLIIDRYLKE